MLTHRRSRPPLAALVTVAIAATTLAATAPRAEAADTSGPTSHSLRLAHAATGSTVDVTPPVLKGLTHPNPYFPRNGTGTIGYDTTDASGLAKIDVIYTGEFGTMEPGHWTFSATPADPMAGTGTASGKVGAVDTGNWHVAVVTLTDQAGNWSRYSSGGGLTCSPSCESSTHDLDLRSMTARVASPPAEPSSSRAAPGPGRATIRWTEPVDDGFAPITGYAITVSPGGKVYSTAAWSRSLTITGLRNDVRYSFAVRAKNVIDTGAARSASAVPRRAIRLSGVNDTNYDGRTDIVGVSRSAVAYLYRGSGKGTISYPGVKVGSSQYGIRSLLGPTLTPTGRAANPVWAVTYDGYLRMYWTGDGGKWRMAWSHAVSGLGSFRHVIAPGDVTGDGLADLLMVSDGGYLYIHSGRRTGDTPFWGRKRIGSGWWFTHITGVGDLNGDRRHDLLARKKDGTLWLYAGNGRGGFASAKRIGSGWNIYHSFSGVGDFNRDGRADLIAVTPGGSLYLYKGTGKGGLLSRTYLGTGFSTFL